MTLILQGPFFQKSCVQHCVMQLSIATVAMVSVVLCCGGVGRVCIVVLACTQIYVANGCYGYHSVLLG